jgi:hypothetical protein
MVEKGYDVIDPYKDTDAKYYHTWPKPLNIWQI